VGTSDFMLSQRVDIPSTETAIHITSSKTVRTYGGINDDLQHNESPAFWAPQALKYTSEVLKPYAHNMEHLIIKKITWVTQTFNYWLQV
jgi:hypothetical protein